jgi:Tfp pilus assembly protein PilF
LFLVVACTTQRGTVSTDRYHRPTDEHAPVNTLNSLQRKALSLMNQGDYDGSITYLQRAIKVDPRQPLNWHYVAQNYWFKKEFAQCRSMVERAQSYTFENPDLERANRILMQQCSE